MESLENEFENYLSALLNNIPKPESDTLFAPNALKYGHYTREFNREASKKLDELSFKVRDQPEEIGILIKILSDYRTRLMTGRF
jgi:hypothetical protein